MKTSYLFQRGDRKDMPHYYDYSVIIGTLKDALSEKYGEEFLLYTDDDTYNEIWDILQEDLKEKSEDLEHVSYLYREKENMLISSIHNDKKFEFIVKPSANNSLFYYPRFKVALARISIFQSHEDNEVDLIFGADQELMLEFLNYVVKRKRDYIKQYVTVYKDTEDGVETEIENITTMVSREDVFMEDSLKKEIYRSIDQFFTEGGSFYTTYNIPFRRGILLYGKPGNGKTTLVKSIASSIKDPVAYWQITEHTSSYTIQYVFSAVAKMAPMALVIEDIDSMPKSVRSVFLNTLDGATSKEGIFLIGTTNYPEKIDPALMNRSGRFDRAYEIKLPSKSLRESYLRYKQADSFVTEEEFEILVNSTEDFSYAQLNELYTGMAIMKHYDGTVDVLEAVKGIREGLRKQKRDNWMNDGGGVGFTS